MWPSFQSSYFQEGYKSEILLLKLPFTCPVTMNTLMHRITVGWGWGVGD